MKLEFCLKYREEHLAVNIRPLFVAFHSLGKVNADISYSHLCVFMGLLKLMLLCKSSTCLPFFLHRDLYKAEICLKG